MGATERAATEAINDKPSHPVMGLTTTLACIVIGLLLSTGSAMPQAAQQQTTEKTKPELQADQEITEEEASPPGQVEVDGNLVLTVYAPIAHLTPEARAEGIATRIVELAEHSSVPPEAVRVQPRDEWTEILTDDGMLMAVTDADAKAAGKTREQIAAEDAQKIQKAIQTYRHDHSWRVIFRAVLKTAMAVVLLVAVLWLIRKIRIAVRKRIETQIQLSASVERKSAWHISFGYIGPMLLAIGTVLRWILILGLLETTLTISLGFYSSTREISLTVTRWVFSQLEMLASAAVKYLPNMLVVAVIVLITTYALRLVRLIFKQIGMGELKISGFYPDWADPTDKLIRLLIIVLALIVAFPYLPGAKSPAFRGISIFVGVLLSLGSSSSIANAVAGVILTYMRSFLVGDWVQIGDTMGEVIERNLLVTRLLTPKAEVITIPNSTVMSGAVKNYSTEAKKGGVIFYTTVGIGFNAPWKTVHELLVMAALDTKHVLREPAPFVLQRSLNDFSVVYELNAYTDTPREVLNIFSDLHRNIQDKFNEAGVEICSPHYSALREGNAVTIPAEYIKAGYRVPRFGIDLAEAGNNIEHAHPVSTPVSDSLR